MVPTSLPRTEFYWQREDMEPRIGPLDDDISRHKKRSLERSEFTGPVFEIGSPLLLQSRSSVGECSGEFGSWLVKAVNKVFSHFCRRVRHIEECPEQTVVASCTTDDSPTAFFGKAALPFQDEQV